MEIKSAAKRCECSACCVGSLYGEHTLKEKCQLDSSVQCVHARNLMILTDTSYSTPKQKLRCSPTEPTSDGHSATHSVDKITINSMNISSNAQGIIYVHASILKYSWLRFGEEELVY